jgi:hypothetical protein
MAAAGAPPLQHGAGATPTGAAPTSVGVGQHVGRYAVRTPAQPVTNSAAVSASPESSFSCFTAMFLKRALQETGNPVGARRTGKVRLRRAGEPPAGRHNPGSLARILRRTCLPLEERSPTAAPGREIWSKRDVPKRRFARRSNQRRDPTPTVVFLFLERPVPRAQTVSSCGAITIAPAVRAALLERPITSG